MSNKGLYQTGLVFAVLTALGWILFVVGSLSFPQGEGAGALESYLARADSSAILGVVYHLAGVISILPGDEEKMRRVNVDGVRNVARAALGAGVGRLVHASSVHAFRRLPHGVTVDESVPFAPDSPAGAYDRTKAEGTLAVLDEVEQGLDAVIACPSGIIGPYD